MVRGPIVAAVAGLLLVGGVINSGLAVAGGGMALSPVDGTYDFNANGWVGTLTVTSAETGFPGILMYYSERGTTESLGGTWSAGTGTLTVYRPLGGGVSQSYTLFLGNHHPSSPVFGGYFTESDTGAMRYGVLADDYLEPGVARPDVDGVVTQSAATHSKTTRPNTEHPEDSVIPDNLIGLYDLDGNGWAGELLLDDDTCPSANITMYYYERATVEQIVTRSWNALTGTLTMVRPLGNGVTQTYTMYIGTHKSQYYSVMFGGYFTESDTGSTQYAAYADRTPGGVGC